MTKISVTNIITLTLTMQYIVINIIIVTIKSLDIVTNIVPISCVQARAAQLRREAWRETWPQLQQLQLLHCYSCSLVTLSAGLTSAQHTLSFCQLVELYLGEMCKCALL